MCGGVFFRPNPNVEGIKSEVRRGKSESVRVNVTRIL